jgi:hypothetical protein
VQVEIAQQAALGQGDGSRQRRGAFPLPLCHVDPILGFAMRRADEPDDADIVAETFLVPGDGIDEVPGAVDRPQHWPTSGAGAAFVHVDAPSLLEADLPARRGR